MLIAQFKTTLPHGACLHSSAVVALGPGGPWPSGPWPVSLWRTPSPAVLNQRANRVTRETAHACHVRTSSVLGEGKAGVERARELEGYGGPARSGAVRSGVPSGGRHAAPRDPRWTPLGLCQRTLVDRRGRHEVAPAPPGGLRTVVSPRQEQKLLLLCRGLGGEKPSLGTPGPVPHGRVCASAPQSPPLADLTVRAERPGTAAGESRVKEGTAGGRVTEESGRVSFGDFSLERRESAAAVGWS